MSETLSKIENFIVSKNLCLLKNRFYRLQKFNNVSDEAEAISRKLKIIIDYFGLEVELEMFKTSHWNWVECFFWNINITYDLMFDVYNIFRNKILSNEVKNSLIMIFFILDCIDFIEYEKINKIKNEGDK
jgi:hypothetical protein